MCYEAAVKQEFNDHSLPRWDRTSTIRRETDVKGWIRRSLTSYNGCDEHDTS